MSDFVDLFECNCSFIPLYHLNNIYISLIVIRLSHPNKSLKLLSQSARTLSLDELFHIQNLTQLIIFIQIDYCLDCLKALTCNNRWLLSYPPRLKPNPLQILNQPIHHRKPLRVLNEPIHPIGLNQHRPLPQHTRMGPNRCFNRFDKLGLRLNALMLQFLLTQTKAVDQTAC